MSSSKSRGVALPRPVRVIVVIELNTEADEFDIIELDGVEPQSADGEVVLFKDEGSAKPEAFVNFRYDAGKAEFTSWGPQATVIVVAGLFMLFLLFALYLQQ